MEHVEYVHTVGMTDAEVEEHLERHEVGVLSLAREGDAYAIPVSYNYDGGRLLVRLTDDEHSKKMNFVDATGEASFLLYAAGDDSWSIVATGRLRLLDSDSGEGFDDATINDLFDEVRIFDEAIDEVVVHVYELAIEGITGRRTANGT